MSLSEKADVVESSRWSYLENTYDPLVDRSLVIAMSSITLGTLMVAIVASRYGKKSDARSYVIAMPILLVLVAVISAGASQTKLRCPDDPLEYCTYNDSEPIVLLIWIGYVVITMVKSWFVYSQR